MKSYLLCLVVSLCLCIPTGIYAQGLYFPPITGDTWEQVTFAAAGYCGEGMDALDSLLEAQNSKAFILLKDGKIVHEKYFDTFTKDSLWQWNSAGKTMTATLVGIAAQENLISVNDMTSTHLGTGWTSAPIEKENAITIRHQLTMTTGLEYEGLDFHCTDPACLIYEADAGTRWSYHNGPYTLLTDVVEAASGQTTNAFLWNRIRAKTGVTGLYIKIGYNKVFFSTPRSMARFGLLTSNNGMWDNTPVLTDTAYLRQMTSTSQNINPSYGYLWWLNGKSSHRLPGSQIDFPGSLAPSAPSDAYAGLGKDGQIVAILPSTNEVWIRMGNAPDGASQLVANVVFDDISKAIEEARCTSSTTSVVKPKPVFELVTNPVYDHLQLKVEKKLVRIEIIDANGRRIISRENGFDQTIDVSNLTPGTYAVIGWNAEGRGKAKQFIKL